MVHARFHFMDGQFRALEFDTATTTIEVFFVTDASSQLTHIIGDRSGEG